MGFSVGDLAHFAVMGVVNVTPDSFSDGGRFLGVDAAVAHGLQLAADGAAVVDVGGESSRPGAEPVTAAVEMARVLPVIERLAVALAGAVPISIDTTKATVAAAAIAAGAAIVNDISAARSDPALLDVVAAADAGLVLMHMQGEPRTMQAAPSYGDVVLEVGEFLAERVAAATAAGVRRDAILADPGIGFGKTKDHSLALLGGLASLATSAGAPIVVGTSRKSVLGAILGGLPPTEREEATLATTVYAFAQGAAMVRVHDVASSARAARFLDVVEQADWRAVA